MKLLLLLAFLGTATAASAAAPPALAATIRAAKWRQRVLLVIAPSADQTELLAQKKLLATEPAGVRARDLLVLDVLPAHLAPADRQFLQQLGLSLQGFTVVLIGKDGGVKQRSTHPLAPAALFGTIDKMPMRRQEMRREQ